MTLIHSFFPIKITLDNQRGYAIIFTMPSLHKSYENKSSVKSNLPSGNLLNTINLSRRGDTRKDRFFL